MANGFVHVACKLPQGVRLRLYEWVEDDRLQNAELVDEHNRFAARAAFAFGQGIDRGRLIVEVERVAVKQRKPNNTHCNILQG